MSPFIVNDNGVGGFKNTDLQKMLAGKIVRVVPYANAYTHGVSGNTRPEDTETLLQLLNLGFVKPTQDPEAFAALQAQFNAFPRNRANSPTRSTRIRRTR
jgi:zinc protease